jgi:hypothetical protein
MPSDIEWDYLLTLALWVLLLVVLSQRAWSGAPVAGLSLAYWGSLALMHLVAGVVQLLPWHQAPERVHTLRGFVVTGYAVAGLLVGHFLHRLVAGRRQPVRTAPETGDGATQTLARVCILFGFVGYFFVLALVELLPGLAAILGNGLNLATAGCCLLWWNHYRRGRRPQARWSAASLLVLPALTVLLHGFLGFGIVALLTALAFMAVRYRPRWVIVVGGPVLVVVGLSLYTVYLDVRNEIRGAVWGARSFSERVLVTASSLHDEWAWFDPRDEHHLENIELRLNQNALVGAAALNIEEGGVPLAWGETLLDGLVALVPRALWADKPIYAGGSDLVTRFTGIHYPSGTSVGIGQVMELYVNFGYAGVFIGFVLIGLALAFVDERAGMHLQRGAPQRFLLFFVPGQTLLLVIGSCAEVLPAAVGSVILCLLCLGLARRLSPGLADAPVSNHPRRPCRYSL